MSGAKAAEVEVSKEQQQLAKQPSGISRFRVVGMVVKAMQRWQNAINPTYSFGSYKHGEEPAVAAPVLASLASSRALTGSPPKPSSMQRLASDNQRTSSGRTASGRPLPGTHYGHKGNLLFKPLPASEPQAQQA